MADSVHRAQLLIEAQNRAKSTLTGFNQDLDKAKRSATGLQSVMGPMGASIAGIAAAWLSWNTAERIIRNVASALMDAERVNSNLADSVETHIGPWAVYQDRIEQFASAVQTATGKNDEAVKQSLQVLIDYGMGLPLAMQTVGQALDLSVGKHMELGAATDLLGKAFVGQTETLARYGIKIKEGLSDAEKFAAVQEQINERVGGRAQAQMNSLAGKYELLTSRLDDLNEAIGVNAEQTASMGSGFDKLSQAVLVATNNLESIKGVLASISGPIPAVLYWLFDWGKAADIAKPLDDMSDVVSDAAAQLATVQSIISETELRGGTVSEELRQRAADLRGELSMVTQTYGIMAGVLAKPPKTDWIKPSEEAIVAWQTINSEADQFFTNLFRAQNMMRDASTQLAPGTAGMKGVMEFDRDQFMNSLVQDIPEVNASAAAAVTNTWEQTYVQWRSSQTDMVSYIQEGLGTLDSSFSQFSSGVVDVMFGMRDGFRDVVKGMAMDWFKFFIDVALSGVKTKLAGGLLDILGLASPLGPVSLLAKTSTPSAYQPAAMMVINHFSGVVSQDFQRETINLTGKATARRVVAVNAISDQVFGGSLSFKGA